LFSPLNKLTLFVLSFFFFFRLYLSGGFGGLGQLMSRAGSLDCRFKLLDYGTDGEDIEVWREYILEDAEFRVKVREDFVAGGFDCE